MKRFYGSLALLGLMASALGCANLGNGKIDRVDLSGLLCVAAQFVEKGAVIYAAQSADPRVQALLPMARVAMARLKCDPLNSGIELSPDECEALAVIIAAARASGYVENNAEAEKWIAEAIAALCPGVTPPALPIIDDNHDGHPDTMPTPTPGHDHGSTPTPGHGDDGHDHGGGDNSHKPTPTPGHGGNDHNGNHD